MKATLLALLKAYQKCYYTVVKQASFLATGTSVYNLLYFRISCRVAVLLRSLQPSTVVSGENILCCSFSVIHPFYGIGGME